MSLDSVRNDDVTVIFTIDCNVNDSTDTVTGNRFNIEALHQFFVTSGDFHVVDFGDNTLSAYFVNVFNPITV